MDGWIDEKVLVINMSCFQVRDLEERLVEKEHELKQMKRNLDESEGAIAQVTLTAVVCSSKSVFTSVGLFLQGLTTGYLHCRCLKGSSAFGRRRWRS